MTGRRTNAGGRGGGAPEPRLLPALLALCVTVTTSYGVLYYAFPVLAPVIRDDTGWSPATITAAFSAGQVVSALGGIAVGRWLERSGPRVVMTTGSVVALPALVGIALASDLWWFAAAWLLAGTAKAMLLYPPAFAAITRWYGPRRVGALTVLTVVAGFSSTIFAPFAGALAAHLGWRETYLVLAAVFALVTVPMHFLLLRPPWRPVERATDGPAVGSVAPLVGGRAFLALTAAMALGAFGVYAVVVNLVPLLDARGFSAQEAAWALGLGGVGQVLGRLAYAPLARRATYLVRTVMVLLSCAVATGLLALIPGPLVVVFGVSMVVGVARGMFTLVEATAVSDRWGTARYATLNGIMHAPLVLAVALAPWAGSVLASALGGYPELFAVLAAVGGVSVLLATLTRTSTDARERAAV